MNRLSGKSALITGGGAGIGAAIALLFCAEDAAVTLVDLDEAALQATCAAIRTEHAKAQVTYCVADISHRDAPEAALTMALQAHGRLDTLINNAAMRSANALADASPEEWHTLLGVNLVGTANFCRTVLPSLRKHQGSSIVNVSSCYAVTGRKGMGLYDASKAALLALTRTLAHEEAPYGIRANAVCPGSTLTDFQVKKAQAAGKPIDQLKAERQATSLLARWASPNEVAYPVLWLASSEASFITGTTLMVDGGLHAM